MKHLKNFRVFEAVIDPLDYSDFLQNFKKHDFNNLDEINEFSMKYGIEFCTYETFKDTLGTEEERKVVPSKEFEIFDGVLFALYNKYRGENGMIMVVVNPEKFFTFIKSDKVNYLLGFMREVFRHESIHIQQVAKMKNKDVYKLDASFHHNPKKYWSSKPELMAYANSLLDHLKDQGFTKEQIREKMARKDFESWIWDRYKKNLAGDDENMNRFMSYLYSYWEKMPEDYNK